MSKINITKMTHICDACDEHFSDNNGVVISFITKKLILCGCCARELNEKLNNFCINDLKNVLTALENAKKTN